MMNAFSILQVAVHLVILLCSWQPLVGGLPLWSVIMPKLKNVRHAPLLAAAVEKGGKRVQVPVFVNTSCRETYLNQTTMRLFTPEETDFTTWSPSTTVLLKMHGIELPVKLGMGQTLGCNMVGVEWLSGADVGIIADYKRNGCVLQRSDEVAEVMQQMVVPRVLPRIV